MINRVWSVVISLTCAVLAPAPSADAQTPCDAAMFVIGSTDASGGFTPSSLSHLNYSEIANDPNTARFAGYRLLNGRVARPGEAERSVSIQITTGNYFDVLHLRTEVGRLFNPDDDNPLETPPAIAVISDRLWATMFYRDPGAVGQKVTLNGRPVTIIGIAPDGFRGIQQPSEETIWIPGATLPDAMNRRSEGYSHFILRLVQDATVAKALREFATFPPLLAKRFPAENQKLKDVSFYNLGPISCQSN